MVRSDYLFLICYILCIFITYYLFITVFLVFLLIHIFVTTFNYYLIDLPFSLVLLLYLIFFTSNISISSVSPSLYLIRNNRCLTSIDSIYRNVTYLETFSGSWYRPYTFSFHLCAGISRYNNAIILLLFHLRCNIQYMFLLWV